jgi:serine/threonine-protein phosphatase PP1 catalytic subunit
VSAHQALTEGYEFPYPDSRKLVTLFSAPTDLGQFGSKSAVIVLDEGANPTLIQFDPIRREGDAPLRTSSREAVVGYKGLRW